MITEEREKHIFAVAELMQKYGKEKKFSDEKCNELYTLGLLHDIGYAFLEEKDYEKHEIVGGGFCRNKDINFGKKFIITHKRIHLIKANIWIC